MKLEIYDIIQDGEYDWFMVVGVSREDITIQNMTTDEQSQFEITRFSKNVKLIKHSEVLKLAKPLVLN